MPLRFTIDNCVPRFFGEDLEVGRLAVLADDSSGVVDEDVELAERGDRSRYHGFHLVALGDVAAHRQGLSPSSFDGLHGICRSRHVKVGDGHFGAFPGKGLGDGPAHPLRSAGDDRHPILQQHPRLSFSGSILYACAR